MSLPSLYAASKQTAKATRSAKALGSSVTITLFHETEARAKTALDAAFKELEQVESLLSIYRSSSQVRILNRHRILQGPQHRSLKTVLRHAQSVARATNGAFDVTVQPLWELFARAKKAGRTPTSEEVKAARSLVDWRDLVVANDEVYFKRRGMALTLNGIAQGFAADRVTAVLRKAGVKHALVDTGEINALGAKPEGVGWKVGIKHPRKEDSYLALAKLEGRCLATSGDYATTFTPNFKTHHIFDPRTGQSPKTLSSVSVVARSGMEADALSTAIFVLGPKHGLALVEKTPEADALLVTKDGRTLRSRNFPFAS